MLLRHRFLTTTRVIDIKWIREQPELVKQRLAARGGADDAKIDEVLQLDEQRRTALKQVET